MLAGARGRVSPCEKDSQSISMMRTGSVAWQQFCAALLGWQLQAVLGRIKRLYVAGAGYI